MNLRPVLFDRLGAADDLELAFRRIALGARLVGLAWMALLIGLALGTGRLSRPVPAWTLLAAAVVWGVASAFTARHRLDLVTSRAAVGIDLVLAGFALFAPSLAGAPDELFYGGYPLIVVAVAAVRSHTAVAAAAVALSVVSLARLGVRDVGGLVESASQIITYAVGAYIFSWVLGVLRRSEEDRQKAVEEVAEARAEVARAEERAEMASHLHDSVLQTLALIQRRAGDPGEVATLARAQERELRAWLFGVGPGSDGGLVEGLRRAAAEVEELHRVRVEVVAVGDVGASEQVTALVAAAREAMINAARHSGIDEVAVFAEVSSDSATVYVRDRGRGFDPEKVPPDRRGVAESIRGRMSRVGGRAEVVSAVGRGTEVRLEVPV